MALPEDQTLYDELIQNETTGLFLKTGAIYRSKNIPLLRQIATDPNAELIDLYDGEVKLSGQAGAKWPEYPAPFDTMFESFMYRDIARERLGKLGESWK